MSGESQNESRAKLLEKAIWAAEKDPHKLPPARKYKRNTYGNKAYDGLEVRKGTSVVIRAYDKGAVIGYMRAIVIDFQDDEHFWDTRTEFITEIVEVSSPTLKAQIGRLRCCGVVDSYWYRQRTCICDIGKDKWKNYLVNKG